MSQEVSHAATLLVVREGRSEGELEVISFLYTKNKEGRAPFTSWKFPTETGEAGETPWKTASNGMYRELSKTPDSPVGFDFRSLGPTSVNGEPKAFSVCRVPGDPGKEARWHDKYVFVLELDPVSEKNLRKEPKQDGPDETIGPPEFVEIGDLWRRMLERGQPFHRAVLFRYIERMARNPKVMARYAWILEDPHSQDVIKSRGAHFQFTAGR